jgi:beta-glucanase (GH16 family)
MLIAFLAAAVAQDASLSANNYAIDEPMPAHTGALLWSDEFAGTALDRSKWSFDTSRNREGWYNKELQYYAADRPENLRLENGRLVIELRKDPQAIRKLPDWGKQKYSSAKIFTKDKAAFKYGFVEASAKLPCSRGSWPAIWMMPQGTAPWPEGGEIDILEHVGSQPNVVHANLHTALFNHTKGNGRGAQKPLLTACNAFHRYQLSWTASEITIGVDGRAYMRVRNDQPGGRAVWPFDTPFYLILNLAMGGDWAASKGIDDAALPQRFEVDYVRVYEMPAETAEGAEGKRSE